MNQNELLSILLLGKTFPEKHINPEWVKQTVDCEATQIQRFQYGEPEEAPAYLLRLLCYLTDLYQYVMGNSKGCLCRDCFNAVLNEVAKIWILPPNATVGFSALAKTKGDIVKYGLVDIRIDDESGKNVLCCAEGHRPEIIALNDEGRNYLRNITICNWNHIRFTRYHCPVQPIKKRLLLDEIEDQLSGARPVNVLLILPGFRVYVASILRDLQGIRADSNRFAKVRKIFREIAGYFLNFPKTVPVGAATIAFADNGNSDKLGDLLKTIDEVETNIQTGGDAVKTRDDAGPSPAAVKTRPELTQTQAAEILGIKTRTIQYWEKDPQRAPAGYPGRGSAAEFDFWAARFKAGKTDRRSAQKKRDALPSDFTGANEPADQESTDPLGRMIEMKNTNKKRTS